MKFLGVQGSTSRIYSNTVLGKRSGDACTLCQDAVTGHLYFLSFPNTATEYKSFLVNSAFLFFLFKIKSDFLFSKVQFIKQNNKNSSITPLTFCASQRHCMFVVFLHNNSSNSLCFTYSNNQNCTGISGLHLIRT